MDKKRKIKGIYRRFTWREGGGGRPEITKLSQFNATNFFRSVDRIVSDH